MDVCKFLVLFLISQDQEGLVRASLVLGLPFLSVPQLFVTSDVVFGTSSREAVGSCHRPVQCKNDFGLDPFHTTSPVYIKAGILFQEDHCSTSVFSFKDAGI